jgi:hypothetical protein
MRPAVIPLMVLFSLAAQELPDATVLRKQVQDAAKKRQSIQYVSELTGEVTLDGKPVTEVLSGGRRIPVASAVGKQTRGGSESRKGPRGTRSRRR